MKDTRSYSQKKRDKMNYRYEYFKKNPGLFGCIWSCAYCHGLIIGKKNVQVDHVIPLNSVFGKNATYNLVAAHPSCNRRKSDKIDGRVAVGYISKLNEEIIAASPGPLKVIYAFVSWSILFLLSSVCRILSFIFGKTSFTIKAVVIGIIVFAIAYTKLSL
ncbi:HNH endonuclease signature motif containing protein [Lachnospiraceae bacterium 47-T17]